MLLQKIGMLILLLAISVKVQSQTEIDNTILLSGSDSTIRQIENLGQPLTVNSSVSLGDLKYGNYNFALASGSDTIVLTFNAPVSRLYNGDLFFFNVPAPNTKPILLSVASMDTLFPLMLNSTDSIGINKLFVGQTIGAIYYNNHAYVITPVTKSCPPDFAQVNENYCIEKTERTAAYFFDAVNDCISNNFELCNAADWYFACTISASLGLTGMTNNYEWLDDASNDVLQVRTLGGGGTCGSQSIYYGNAILQKYRCCYILR